MRIDELGDAPYPRVVVHDVETDLRERFEAPAKGGGRIAYTIDYSLTRTGSNDNWHVSFDAHASESVHPVSPARVFMTVLDSVVDFLRVEEPLVLSFIGLDSGLDSFYSSSLHRIGDAVRRVGYSVAETGAEDLPMFVIYRDETHEDGFPK